MKLCKDCIHFIAPIEFPEYSPAFCRDLYIIEPVYGEKIFQPCAAARKSHHLCGPNGTLFKTK